MVIMPSLTYSKEVTQHQLELLPSRSRVAFGLSCCERMLPNYMAFKREVKWGDEQPLRKALDELWKHVEGETMDTAKVRSLTKECEVVAPDSENFSALLTTAAQDACFAICSVLDYVLQENPERIAKASSFAIDTLDLYIQELQDGFSNTPTLVSNTPERQERIRLHPLMQCELARQDTDLKLLASNPDLKSLKSQWRAPSKSNIDL